MYVCIFVLSTTHFLFTFFLMDFTFSRTASFLNKLVFMVYANDDDDDAM